jgi:hypothetical protein
MLRPNINLTSIMTITGCDEATAQTLLTRMCRNGLDTLRCSHNEFVAAIKQAAAELKVSIST